MVALISYSKLPISGAPATGASDWLKMRWKLTNPLDDSWTTVATINCSQFHWLEAVFYPHSTINLYRQKSRIHLT